MNLLVYQFEHSPYCIPVTRALEALSVPFEIRNISNADRREIIELTQGAYYQVPVLVHGERTIFESTGDSTDVAHYLDQTFAGGRLFPRDCEGWQQIILPHIENEVEGVTFKLVDPSYLRELPDSVERTMIRRHKERRFGRGCVEAWDKDRESLNDQAFQLLAPFDHMTKARPFLFGDAPVYSDFALFGILGNLTYRNYNALPDLSSLAAWFERMKTFRYPV